MGLLFNIIIADIQTDLRKGFAARESVVEVKRATVVVRTRTARIMNWGSLSRSGIAVVAHRGDKFELLGEDNDGWYAVSSDVLPVGLGWVHRDAVSIR